MERIKVISINGEDPDTLIDRLQKEIDKIIAGADSGKYPDGIKEQIFTQRDGLNREKQRLYKKWKQGYIEEDEYKLGLFLALNSTIPYFNIAIED